MVDKELLDAELKEAIEKGTKAWAGIDPTEFVEDLRGDSDDIESDELDTEK